MTQRVRFVAFTDHHADVGCIESVITLVHDSRSAFIVCAGDFTIMTEGIHPSMMILGRCELPVYFIGGNHEHDGICRFLESAYPTLHYVDLKVEIEPLPGGLRVQIAGLDGTEDLNPHYGEKGEFYASYLEILKAQADPLLPLVLLSHFPPAGTATCGKEPVFKGDLCVGFKEGPALGSRNVRRMVESLKPAVVVTGHFHDRFGESDRNGGSWIVNPGPDGMLIEMAFPSEGGEATVTLRKTSRAAA
ncbi:MAG: metallophosphoesterase family protein [Nitrospirae bacterium]|nr:metallophosphoesterase family protein [Nitrospirota bacterium]